MRTTCSVTVLTAAFLVLIASPGFAQRSGSGDQPAWWPVQHSGPAHPDSISGGGVHTASDRASAREGAEKAARDDMTSWLYYRSLRAFQRDHIGTSLVGLERRVPVEEERRQAEVELPPLLAAPRHPIGEMIDSGQGVPQDYPEAYRLCSLAADQGHARIHYNLGVMCALDRGVSEDTVHAHLWLNPAASRETDPKLKTMVMKIATCLRTR